jgi:hypothetical protein
MKKIPDRIYTKFESLAKRVLDDLKAKGHVIPVQQPNGSVKFDKFLVTKNSEGLYSVTGSSIIYQVNLNLPQSAALIANDLALGRIQDTKIIELDRDYGFKLFEEELYQQASKRKKNTLDQSIFYETRRQIAKTQKDALKNRILRSFKKLIDIT